MNWMNLYSADIQPTDEQVSNYISNPLWAQLNDFLQENYKVEPRYSYSACSAQPGWNIKYQKSGRSLCTLYPMEGFFIALVVIGTKEQTETELRLPLFTEHVQSLMKTAGGITGARWLMINVTDDSILDDVKTLIQIRRKIKK